MTAYNHLPVISFSDRALDGGEMYFQESIPKIVDIARDERLLRFGAGVALEATHLELAPTTGSDGVWLLIRSWHERTTRRGTETVQENVVTAALRALGARYYLEVNKTTWHELQPAGYEGLKKVADLAVQSAKSKGVI